MQYLLGEYLYFRFVLQQPNNFTPVSRWFQTRIVWRLNPGISNRKEAKKVNTYMDKNKEIGKRSFRCCAIVAVQLVEGKSLEKCYSTKGALANI